MRQDVKLGIQLECSDMVTILPRVHALQWLEERAMFALGGALSKL